MLHRAKLLSAAGLLALMAILVAGCGDGGNDDQPANGSGQGGGDSLEPSARLEISAESLEFDKNRLVAPANTEISLAFTNNDAGVLHNVSVYRSRSAEEEIFTGELFLGVETQTYSFETPEPGSFFFRCDVHPDTMTGSFVTR